MDQKNSSAVEYDGQCAFAVSVGRKGVAGGRHQAIIDGRTYPFKNRVAKLLFKLLPNRVIKADEVWNRK